MNLFLDTSVVLAACGRMTGASRAIFDFASAQGWRLLASDYVLREVEKNIRSRLPDHAHQEWEGLRPNLVVVADEWSHSWPVVFPKTKDRPVLFAAAAVADVLLALDRDDFGSVMTAGFYGLLVMKPGDFLRREREAGRLR